MPKLNLAAAVTITEQALAHAGAQSMNPMTVAVLDAGGHLLALSQPVALADKLVAYAST